MKYSRISQTFGPYYVLVVLALMIVAVLSGSRLGLLLWQFDRASAAGNIGLLLLQGIRADLILVGLLLVVPILLAPIWGR